MGAASVTRWVLLATLRQGSAWGALLVLAAFAPLVTRLAPFRIGSYAPETATALDVAFVGAFMGCLFALVPLGDRGALFRSAGPLQRTAAEGAALLATATLFSLTALAVPLGLGDLGPTSDLATTLAPLLWAHLHLVGIGLLALRVPAPAAVRGAFLVSFAWLLPILSVTSDGDAGFVAVFLGASLHPMLPHATAAPPWEALASIAALWWLATLLGHPRSEQR